MISSYNGRQQIVQESPIEHIGPGRLTHNLSTRKTFYVADYGFIRL